MDAIESEIIAARVALLELLVRRLYLERAITNQQTPEDIGRWAD